MNGKLWLFYILTAFVLVACSESGPHPKSMIGLYEVDVTLHDKNIKKNTKTGLQDAKREIQKELEKMEKQFSAEPMPDTSTVEGKWEYASREFGKSMQKLGSGIAESVLSLGEELHNVVNGFPSGLQMEVVLQENGAMDIKSKSLASAFIPDYTWAVSGDSLILTNESKEKHQFLIKEKTDKGFVLENNTFILHCRKKVK